MAAHEAHWAAREAQWNATRASLELQLDRERNERAARDAHWSALCMQLERGPATTAMVAAAEPLRGAQPSPRSAHELVFALSPPPVPVRARASHASSQAASLADDAAQ